MALTDEEAYEDLGWGKSCSGSSALIPKLGSDVLFIKSKFGDSGTSKTKVAQVNEVLLKVLCHNICVVIHEMFELEIDVSTMFPIRNGS